MESKRESVATSLSSTNVNQEPPLRSWNVWIGDTGETFQPISNPITCTYKRTCKVQMDYQTLTNTEEVNLQMCIPQHINEKISTDRSTTESQNCKQQQTYHDTLQQQQQISPNLE